MYQIGWFSTGRGQGSLNLLHSMVNAVKNGKVRAEIAFVFCSRQTGDAPGSDIYIKQVQDYGLRLVCLSSKRFEPDLRQEGKTDPAAMARWRRKYDMEIMERLKGLSTDINVLAGYMLILSSEMCEKYNMINLHPATPDGPTGTWQEVIWKLIETRASYSGNMMHLVTRELDRGAPVTYSEFPLTGPGFNNLWLDLEEKLNGRSLEEIIKTGGCVNPLFQKIRYESARREIPLVTETLRAFAAGQLLLEDGKIQSEGKTLKGPYCLTNNIEKQLQDE